MEVFLIVVLLMLLGGIGLFEWGEHTQSFDAGRQFAGEDVEIGGARQMFYGVLLFVAGFIGVLLFIAATGG